MSERQKKKLAQREALKIKRRMIEKVRHSNVAFNLNLLVDGWLELESDPGTFSLLIEDFGCSGAQVDEIYDLEQKFEGPILGFIFLFKWINNKQNDRSRNQKFFNNSTLPSSNNSTIDINNSNLPSSSSPNKSAWTYVEDESIISEMFFAKQMISNSCATHALLSILLNCDYRGLHLGPTLTRLKEHTKIMDPENKGYAIGNLPELAKAHNSHASYSSLYNSNKPPSHSSSGMSYIISGNQRTNLQQQKKHEAYHFVSYVPINNRLYELDGLKNYPIDHGPFDPKEGWTEKFRSVIKERLLINKSSEDAAMSNEIRYNLMAVTPDKRVSMRSSLRKLRRTNRVIEDSIHKLTKRVFTPISHDVDIPNPPYSPLSNGTLTASEVGSVANSPTRCIDDFQSDNDNNVERLFFVKFTNQDEPTIFREENTDPAHKNCIIDHEPTAIEPLNLKLDPIKNEIQQPTNQQNTRSTRRNPAASTTSTKTQDNGGRCRAKTETHDTKVKPKKHDTSVDITTNKESSEENKKEEEINDNTNDTENESITAASSHAPVNGSTEVEDGSDKDNEVKAHNNEKYNLSSKPPFDFNILDEMQHVHFDKSTLKDMKILSMRQASEIKRMESLLKEEIDKRRKYKIDNSRRTHNYEPFIMTFLSLLAKQGNLADLIEKDLGINTEDQQLSIAAQISNSTPSSTNKTIRPPTGTTQNYSNVNKLSNGMKNHLGSKSSFNPKPKYKYVSTGRPVGRPRKNPLPTESPVKTTNTSSTR